MHNGFIPNHRGEIEETWFLVLACNEENCVATVARVDQLRVGESKVRVPLTTAVVIHIHLFCGFPLGRRSAQSLPGDRPLGEVAEYVPGCRPWKDSSSMCNSRTDWRRWIPVRASYPGVSLGGPGPARESGCALPGAPAGVECIPV